VARLSYVGVLAFIVFGSSWLEVALRTRVLARWRRMLASILPVALAMMVWDAYAITRGHWTFSPTQTLGWLLPADIPVEELIFFLVVPFAAVLTFEGVRSVTGWPLDDAPADPADPTDSTS
jgi:lycopene cyclase domain-containing protein